MKKAFFIMTVIMACAVFVYAGPDEDLIKAVNDEKYSAMAAAIKAGADLNTTDAYGATPLMYAAYYNFEEGMRYLIEQGAEVNKTDWKGQTALMYLYADNPDIVALFLSAGADINIINDGGGTVLDGAISGEDIKKLALFLEHGADLTHTDYRGETYLIKAVETGNARTVELLLQHGADVTAKTKKGETALDRAKEKGNGIIIYLIENTASEK